MAVFHSSIIIMCLARILQGGFVLLVLAAIAWTLLQYKSRCTKRLPHGPTGIPLLGYLPFLGRKPYLTFSHLARRYGSVFSVQLGAKLVVVLNGRKTIREAFVTKSRSFSGRPRWVLNRVNQGKGIANQQANPTWRQHRRFVLSVMRSIGEGRTQMENKVAEEVSHLIAEFFSYHGKAMDMTYPVQLAFSNVICSVCFGQRYQPNDPDFKSLLHMADVFFRHLTSASAANFIPLLWYLPLPGHRAVRKMYAGILDFVSARVEEHKADLDPGSPRDLIDIYLIEIAKRRADQYPGANPPTVNGFTEDYVKHVVADLFFGGTETVNAGVLWGLACMVMYPDIQTRVQKELDEVIGQDRAPILADRAHLSYTQATLQEINRRCNVIPCAIPHVTTEDVELNGFVLPKGTTVTANLYSAHMDPDYWREPERFDPTRFLDETGKLVIKGDDSYMPFSLGPRACLGEQLAKCEMFLAFTGILQKFRLELPEGGAPPTLDGLPGITHAPRMPQIRPIPRDYKRN